MHSGSGAMAHAPETEAPAYHGGKEPPPPTWDGAEPGIQLAAFEKNVRLWEYESELDAKKRGVRLLRSLTGIARSVADTLEFEQVASEKGVENIVSVLRKHFAPHLEVSLPRAFERAVYGQPRSSKETMQEYLIRQERNFYLLSKESLDLPDVAVGYIVYRQASLTESQELRFSAWSEGKYDMKTVATCLRKLEKVVPEHKERRGSMAYMLEDEQAPEEDHEDLSAVETGQFVYVEEDDLNQLWDEADVQVALATYHEVRKAIQAQQKGRQYYGKSGGRGSYGFKSYMKGKKKVTVEELKLRTRCGRCGLVGHWAKECKNPPDQRGRQHPSAGSASGKSSAPSSMSTTSHGATTQQSWYVSAGTTCDLNCVWVQQFLFQCRGFCTGGVTDNNVDQIERSNAQESDGQVDDMKGSSLVLL